MIFRHELHELAQIKLVKISAIRGKEKIILICEICDKTKKYEKSTFYRS